jgi:Fe2+ transport system protein FeoA
MSLGMSGGGSVGAKDKVDEEEEIVRKRLEAMGMHVGANIVER